MNLDKPFPELDKPSPELDLAVAEAVGLKEPRVAGACYPLPLTWRCCVFEHDTGTVQETRNFRPSTDWTDAMEAAEKVGLFAVYLLGNRAILKRKYKGGWILETFTEAPTGPLAICAAILKIKENE